MGAKLTSMEGQLKVCLKFPPSLDDRLNRQNRRNLLAPIIVRLHDLLRYAQGPGRQAGVFWNASRRGGAERVPETVRPEGDIESRLRKLADRRLDALALERLAVDADPQRVIPLAPQKGRSNGREIVVDIRDQAPGRRNDIIFSGLDLLRLQFNEVEVSDPGEFVADLQQRRRRRARAANMAIRRPSRYWSKPARRGALSFAVRISRTPHLESSLASGAKTALGCGRSISRIVTPCGFRIQAVSRSGACGRPLRRGYQSGAAGQGACGASPAAVGGRIPVSADDLR